jgi:hypothetical protein
MVQMKGVNDMVFVEITMWLIGLIIGFYTIAHLVMWLKSVLELRTLRKRIGGK